MSLQAVIALLPKLTEPELDQVSQHIKVIRSNGFAAPIPPHPNDIADNSTFALACISEQLAAMGCEYTPLKLLQISPELPSFKHKLQNVERYLLASQLTRLQRRAILMLGTELLYNNLVEMQLTVSARVIMRHFHRIPAILNRSFPGYAQAGLLCQLFQAKVEKQS